MSTRFRPTFESVGLAVATSVRLCAMKPKMTRRAFAVPSVFRVKTHRMDITLFSSSLSSSALVRFLRALLMMTLLISLA